ncbi:MAG: hypothetical protein AB8C13_10595 [Phycisphaerales bacterium]
MIPAVNADDEMDLCVPNAGDCMYDFADEPKYEPTNTVANCAQGAVGESVMQAGSFCDLPDTDLPETSLSGTHNDFDQSFIAGPETRYVNEFSMDLLGGSDPEALYRAAGCETAVPRCGRDGVQYGCPCCGRGVGRVIRVRATQGSHWQAVCAMCAASILDQNPEALIGGVVRAGRRRRRKQLRDAS